MKTIRFAVLALLALSLALPAASQVQDYKQIKYPTLRPHTIPTPERITLKNGMVVMLLEDHELPVVEAYARIRTGSRLEPADRAGLASILGDVLRTGGTRSMTGDQVDDFLEARGASIETDVSVDSGYARVWCLKQDFPQVLKLFAEILRSPALAEDRIAIAKNQIGAGIARRNDDPQEILFREGAKLVYGADSPYARVPEFGTIVPVTKDDLRAFHARYFHPNRVILGLVGDFNTKEMVRQVESVFGDWAKGPAVKDPEAPFRTTPRPGYYYVQKEDMTQSNIYLGHLGIRKDNPDIYAVDVLNEAFGGSFAARLFSNVRSRKGLAYAVRGTVGSQYDRPGAFTCWMTTKTETTAAGIDALMEEIDGLHKNPLSEAEVQRAKESILNSFVFNFDSKAKVMNQQLTYAYFGFPPDYLSRYRANIEKVTAAKVTEVAKKYVHKDQLAVLVVGPSKGQDRPLESFGKVTKLDITIPPPPAPKQATAK
jgi:zinc protease